MTDRDPQTVARGLTPEEQWIAHEGGECPVDPETLVLVRWSNGAESRIGSAAGKWMSGPRRSIDFWKDRDYRNGFIVAYCPVRALLEKERVDGR